MIPKTDIRISISGINGGEPFQLMERPDLWRRVYNVNPTLFDNDEDIEEDIEIEDEHVEEEETQDWSSEEYNIIYLYFDEGVPMRQIADDNDDYTYNYVRGVINNAKQFRNGEQH